MMIHSFDGAKFQELTQKQLRTTAPYLKLGNVLHSPK